MSFISRKLDKKQSNSDSKASEIAKIIFQTPYDKLAYSKNLHLRASTVPTSTPLSKDQIYMQKIREHESIPANCSDSDDFSEIQITTRNI